MFFIMNTINDLSDAGRLLRERRKVIGLSQAQLAAAAGLTRARISELEHGKANLSLRSYLRLVQALGAALYLEPASARPTLTQLRRSAGHSP